MAGDLFEKRKHLIMGFIIVVFAIIISKLFAIQIINKSYKKFADNNSIKEKIVYPGRGLIYDRNGKLIVCNEAVYDLLVTPRMVKKDFDTLAFCKLVDIEKEDFIEKFDKCKKYSRYKASVLISQISKEDIAIIEESLYKFEGFEIQPRTVRSYPYAAGAHLLGDIGEASEDFLKKNPDYRMGDYIGLSGLEKVYEDDLKGIKGIHYVLANVHNVEMGPYENGDNDVKAVQGKDLVLSLDIDLQVYGEKLMKFKRGSVVAIEPKTGGILAMVSAPSYDPNLLVGRERGANYLMLVNDLENKPLLNRALMGEYSPGSTFKTVVGLYGLEIGVITKDTKFSCAGPGATPIRCTHFHESPLNVVSAMRESCNPFFRRVFENGINNYPTPAKGLDKWATIVKSFGLGKSFNSDIGYNKAGLIPNSSFYDKVYPNKNWKSSTIRSLSIGQGEVLVTPIQLANVAATIANKGYYIEPHFVQSIISPTDTIHPFEKSIHKTQVNSNYFDCIQLGMVQVVESGTARWYGQIDSVKVCGKTGTVQNVGKNHAIFIAFAPIEDPQIAIAVVVENSGYGSTFAVPVASLMIEKYLKGEITRKRVEDHVLNTKLIDY